VLISAGRIVRGDVNLSYTYNAEQILGTLTINCYWHLTLLIQHRPHIYSLLTVLKEASFAQLEDRYFAEKEEGQTP
jgi:hypothetical protein